MRNRYLVGLSLSLMISLTAYAEDFHPVVPDQNLTPGALCQKPDSYRYPEHIAYCERDVDNDVKWKIIQLYMEKMPSLNINGNNRSQYKIDHFIPLCMGGANDIHNLWPQHMNVYKYTDIIELDICKELEAAEITQAQAVAKMKFAKSHIDDIKIFENPVDRMKYIADHYSQPTAP